MVPLGQMSNPPSPNDFPAWLAWITTIGVTETAALLQHLHVEPGEHRHFTLPYDKATARNYLLTRCLLDVQHAIASLVRLRTWLLKPGETEPSRALDEITTASIAIEQSGWRRKLVEALARLVAFSTTNTDEHYWGYLLVNEADQARREAESFAKDWSSSSACLVRRSEFLQSQIAAAGVALPVWYARGTKQGLRPAPATDILRGALDIASESEQAALGYSYTDGFSEPSRLLHFSTTPLRSAIERDTLSFGSSHLLLLASAICRRAAALAGVSDLIVKLEPTVRSDLLPKVGDYVVVTLDRQTIYLAEVVAWNKQLRAGGGIRVRFIDASPYTDVVEDDLPSSLVQPFLRGAELMAGLVAEAPELATAPEDERRAACRAGAREAWARGVRDTWVQDLAKR